MRAIWCGAVLVALAACDAGAPSCKDAVAKAVKHGVSEDEQPILTQVCEAKKWSGDVRGCLGRASSNEDASTCLKPVMEDVTLANAEAAANAELDRLAKQLQALQTQLDALSKDIDASIDRVGQSRSDEERTRANAALRVARAQKDELEAKMEAARTSLAQTKRVHISRECLDDPLAAGCQ